MESFRRMIQSTLGRVFLALVLVVFVLFAFGTQFLTPPGAQGEVAIVNERRIQSRELDQAVERQMARYANQIDRKTLEKLIRREDVLDGIIREYAMQDAARESGVIVPPQMVQETLLQIPDFQDESGKFSQSLFQQLVLRNGFANAAAFREYIEERILSQQLAGAISDSAFATRQDLELLTRMGEQKRDLAWAVFSPAAFAAAVSVTDAEVRARYDGDAAGFLTEEQFAVEYLEVNLADYAGDQKVDEAAVRAKYDEMVTQARDNAERRVAHILIATGDVRDEAAARARAAEVIAKLAAGKTFAALAAEYSDDPGSKEQGGDLGFIGKGVLEPALDSVAFSLAANNVSDAVKAEDGFHLLKVLEVRAVEVPPFATARASIVAGLSRDQARQRYDEIVSELGTLAYESDSLGDIATKLGLVVRKSGLFGRNSAPGVLANPKVMEEVLSDDVLLDGRNSPVVSPADGQSVVVKLAEHRKPVRRPFEEVANDIRMQLVQEKASALAAEKAGRVRDLVNGGTPVAQALADAGVALQQAQGVSRADQQVPREILQAAFAAKQPAAGATSAAVADMQTGAQAVVAVSNVVDGSLLGADPDRVANDRGQLAGQFGNLDLQRWGEFVVADADVTRLDAGEKEGSGLADLLRDLKASFHRP